MEKKIFINFVVRTDEAIRLVCHNAMNHAEKEIFVIDEKFYFYYLLNKNAGTSTVSLREITEEEYNARKAEILNCQPDAHTRQWEADGNKYSLWKFRFGTWKRNIASCDCIFLSENRVKDLADSVVAQVTHQRDAEVTLDKAAKADYARRCGGLACKLGVSFVNVMRIGPEKGKLILFKESYQRALIKVQALPPIEQRKLYDMLNGGRKLRAQALDMLDVKYYGADVNLMDFEELIQNLWRSLSEYTEQSVRDAIRYGIDMDYEERLDVYNKLAYNSRELKRAGLAQLGVQVEAIEFKRYPIEKIKNELGATLGMDSIV